MRTRTTASGFVVTTTSRLGLAKRREARGSEGRYPPLHDRRLPGEGGVIAVEVNSFSFQCA
jgi:hypothetical protein